MQQNHLMQATAQLFSSSFQREGRAISTPRHVGLENEYVMVASDGSIMKPEVLQELWRALMQQGWEAIRDETTAKIISVIKPRQTRLTTATHGFDLITTDFGYATLEINLAPAQTLQEAQSHLFPLLHMITAILSRYDTRLLGYGVQPLSRPKRALIGPKSRYELLFDVREDEGAHNPKALSVDLHCINAACQTQVEVSSTEAIPIVNALNATAGLRIALLANSSIWQKRTTNYKALRELFWDWGWPTRKMQNGIPPRFRDIEHYIDYLLDFRAILVKRGDSFYRLDNDLSFRHFFLNENGALGRDAHGQTQTLQGSPEDITTQYSFAWFDARLHPLHGTVEDRVSCQQPPQAPLCASALALGLIENASELVNLANKLSLDQWRDIRLLACTHGQNFSYPGTDVKALMRQLLQAAYQGLKERNYGEEIYLEPLYTRLERGLCPADEARSHFLNGGIMELIDHADMRHVREGVTAREEAAALK